MSSNYHIQVKSDDEVVKGRNEMNCQLEGQCKELLLNYSLFRDTLPLNSKNIAIKESGEGGERGKGGNLKKGSCNGDHSSRANENHAGSFNSLYGIETPVSVVPNQVTNASKVME
jgi:hypothetical protein